MGKLLYKEDFDEARDRLTTWWDGGDIGRPPMLIKVRQEQNLEDIPPVPEPEGWVTDYSTMDYDYRVYNEITKPSKMKWLCEDMPIASADLGANTLALYLGCKGVEEPGTVWFQPFIEDPDSDTFDFDENGFYWKFTLKLVKELAEKGEGKFIQAFPDLIEGIDTLAAMRDTEKLLFDMMDRPEWVHDCLTKITDYYFKGYDVLYDMTKDDRGGSFFWIWAPGRMSKLQCDYSAMISPDMFGEFMVPVLEEMTSRLDYCIYHWDGPGAIPHHDHLLGLENLNAIQWTPGAGADDVFDAQWWPLYHKTIDAGKKVCAWQINEAEQYEVLKKEFGPKFKQFIFGATVDTMKEAEGILNIVTD